MKKHGPWTIKATRRIFENDSMQVNEDEVTGPDGENGTYATVKFKNGALALAVDDDGFAYFVKEFRYALGREDTTVVGGAIDEGETPLEAARRELHEEIGIEAVEWTELGRMHHSTSMVDSTTTLFLARDLTFTEKNEDGSEELKTIKLSFDKAVEKALNGDFTHGSTCVLILRAQQYMRQNSK